MYSLPKWAMLSSGQSRAGACPGYFAKAGSVLREGELDDDDDDDDDDDGDDDDDECAQCTFRRCYGIVRTKSEGVELLNRLSQIFSPGL